MNAVLGEAGTWPRDDEDQTYVMAATSTPVESTSWGQIKAMFR